MLVLINWWVNSLIRIIESVDKVHQIISVFIKHVTLKHVGQNLCCTVSGIINIHTQPKLKNDIFLNEVWFSSSQLSLWHRASQCVTGGSSQVKIIFGSGTRLNIEPSEYWCRFNILGLQFLELFKHLNSSSFQLSILLQTLLQQLQLPS